MNLTSRAAEPFCHSLASSNLVTATESALDLDAFKSDLRAQHQPANLTEEILVNEMAEQFWRMQRARKPEAQTLDTGLNLDQLAIFPRMMTSAERGFHRSRAALRKLQKDRWLVSQKTQKAENGFVPQKSKTENGFVPQNDELATEDDVWDEGYEEPYVHVQATPDQFTPEELARFAEIYAKLASRCTSDTAASAAA